MWEDFKSCESSLMMYVIFFPMRKSSGYVCALQTWTVPRLICWSSTSLNNPPSVFLGGKSYNQILTPEAQTRWCKLKSWRSVFFSLSPLFCCPLLRLGVSPIFIALVLSFPLLSPLSSCSPPPSIWLLVVYGVRKPGKLTWSSESSSI